MWDRNQMLWYVQNCFWLLHFLKSHAMILCCVCKQLVVGSIVCRFHNHGQQVLTVSVVETPLTGAHLQSTASVLLKMGILYSKDCQRSRSESRPSQRHLAHSGQEEMVLSFLLTCSPSQQERQCGKVKIQKGCRHTWTFLPCHPIEHCLWGKITRKTSSSYFLTTIGHGQQKDPQTQATTLPPTISVRTFQ